MPENRLISARYVAAVLLFGFCAACADSNGGLRAACADDSLTAKPAACGGDLHRQLDDVTRATTQIQRVRQGGSAAGR